MDDIFSILALANTDGDLRRLSWILDFLEAPVVIDLSNAQQDYELQLHETAYISFSDATQVLLHIATPNNSYYELHVIPSNTGGTSGGQASPIYLYPNNTTYSGAFYYAEVCRNSIGLSSVYQQYSAFRIGWIFSCITAWITNRTQYKNVRGIYDIYGNSPDYPTVIAFSTDWRNTTTPWTSLGTIVFPQSTSGEIFVFRAR